METPAGLGYYMPAEWAQHAATWISWPHNLDTWPGVLPEAERIMASAVRALAAGETVRINVLNAEHEHRVAALVGDVPAGRAVFHVIPTNDAWCRDHGAIFVTRHGSEAPIAATAWSFNAWGGKYPPFDLDDAVAAHMAVALDVPCFSNDLVMEGGSIEVNGRGLLLTTTSCLLNPNRNPDRSRAEIERALGDNLGAVDIVWLSGDLVGDDTDGHIDNLVRFVDASTVLVSVEPDPSDDNHAPLADNLARLRSENEQRKLGLRIIELPMPEPVFGNGLRLPASYANFYIGNRVVLLPAYGGSREETAVDTLRKHFPDREIVPLDCSAIIHGFGAFHCLTQQVPFT